MLKTTAQWLAQSSKLVLQNNVNFYSNNNSKQKIHFNTIRLKTHLTPIQSQ